MNMENNNSELIELTTVQGDIEAEIIVGICRSEGIEVLVKSDMAHGSLPFTVDGMGQVKLMVMKDDLQRARTILEEYREKE
ncbi:MAG: DUF2007 domain-containing protein [Candidatus Krumholzibacteriota bacterium]|nr:DUF2007 domain-containing protein [Candidatus Krumholzibacteriota bacterium]